ncbi:MAG: Ldh family oxidoreductase, partial [Xanthobacteraceae bacterium]
MDDRTSLLCIPSPATRALIADAFAAAGLPGDDAARCAELMTEADLTGADGHGIFRLPQYVRRLNAGGFNKRPAIAVTKTGPATALVDGDNGMGHLVMSRATDEAIALARETGVSWVGVRRSNHAGPAGLYAEMPAAHGMIGVYAAVANANHMATWGGADLLLGTNPLAIGVPSGGAPLVFDMATSIVAYGTVKKYALRGLTMPQGWFVKPETGETITDPNKSGEGILLPTGEYKGSGLALMIGLLAGVLNGAAFGRDVVDFNADDASETNTGHFLVVVDIARFLPLAAFTAEVDRHVRDLRASQRLPGVD